MTEERIVARAIEMITGVTDAGEWKQKNPEGYEVAMRAAKEAMWVAKAAGLAYSDGIERMKEIAEAVCKANLCSLEELRGKSRDRGKVIGRKVFAVLSLRKTNLSEEKVGAYIMRDHSTISFYNNGHDAAMKYDKMYSDQWNKTIGLLK